MIAVQNHFATGSEDNPLFVDPIIGPGERRKPIKHLSWMVGGTNDDGLYSFDVEAEVDENDETYAVPILNTNQRLYFRVIISYRGPFTSDHETSACWLYQKGFGYFDIAGPETNYEK